MPLTREQLRLAGRFLRHRFAPVHPFEVQAMLLNACNLRCAYCSCPELPTRLLTTEQWLAIIRELAAAGTMRLKWQGGEPTLHKGFRPLCAAVRAAGIRCAVVTNGLKIAEDPSLLDDVDEVVFSLDSLDPATNDRVRGAGVCAAVQRAIAVARQVPHRPRLYINMVVMRANRDHIEAMLQFCEAHGIGLNVQPAVFGLANYDEAARPLALDNAETRVLFANLARWKRAGRPLMFAAASYEQAIGWGDYGELTRPSHGRSACVMGRVYVHIEPNGDVYPCVQTTSTFAAKNLVADGVRAALAHARTHECGDCYSAYLNERKALFGLRPTAVLEYLRRA